MIVKRDVFETHFVRNLIIDTQNDDLRHHIGDTNREQDLWVVERYPAGHCNFSTSDSRENHQKGHKRLKYRHSTLHDTKGDGQVLYCAAHDDEVAVEEKTGKLL